MQLGIAGKVALVTGASSGLGEAVALQLAAEGVQLAVSARRRDRLLAVADRALALGAQRALAFVGEQSEAGAAQLVREVREALGPVDILVVNGGGPRPGGYLEMGSADWDQAYALTFKSAMALVDAALPDMRARAWGRIVALQSVSVKQPLPSLVLSNAFRTAVVAALKTLSREVAAAGITVNCVATGFVETERLRAVFDTPEKRAAAERQIPLGRVATPEEFAPLAAFLCGEPARYVTGQTISVDGGLVGALFG